MRRPVKRLDAHKTAVPLTVECSFQANDQFHDQAKARILTMYGELIDRYEQTKGETSMTMAQQSQQTVPVQIHQTDRLIVLAAPMPGLEPQDISVVVAGNKVTLRGSYRGSRLDSGDLLISEWTIGPYYREVILPAAVNGPLTNATYGNGVLVLAMPMMDQDHQGSYTEFQLDVVEATRGQRIGHTGSDLQPTTTAEHRHKMQQTAHEIERP
jgi:HSP20 family protein